MIFVLPAEVDDPGAPSGGNVYDRRMCQALAAAGRAPREVKVAGTWPRPDAGARSALSRALAGIPDGEIVLIDGLVACGVPEAVTPHAGRLRLVVLLHLPLAEETGLEPGEAADLDARERRTLGAASAVVVTGPAVAGRVIRHHGLSADRVHVVIPGTDPAPLAPGTDGVSRLLCVASVTVRKGHDLLVEALATVAGPQWTCAFTGPLRDSGYLRRLREAIEGHGISDRVTFTGPRTGEALAATYAAADLVVLPSRAETFGMVVTEALARGIPVLATRVPGVPETLGQASDGSVPGLLVPPDDTAALAVALRRWFGDEELRRRLKRSAHLRRGMLTTWDETSRHLARMLEMTVG